MWNFLPEYVVNTPSVDSFKNRLDKQWSNEEIVYDYKAATPTGRKIFAPAGTQDLRQKPAVMKIPTVFDLISGLFAYVIFGKKNTLISEPP